MNARRRSRAPALEGIGAGMTEKPTQSPLEQALERAKKWLNPDAALILSHLEEIQSQLDVRDMAEGRVAELERERDEAREKLRLALDALTDAEQYHRRACAKDGAHDHALLRKLQATIPVVDAVLASAQAPSPKRDEVRG